MSLRDLRGYLWDVAQACTKVRTFCAGKTLGDYLGDEQLRSAVERQLITAGEALAQAIRYDSTVTDRISESRQVIAFRNRMVHAYLTIDDVTVWGVVQHYIPRLLSEAEEALAELEGEDRGGTGLVPLR